MKHNRYANRVIEDPVEDLKQIGKAMELALYVVAREIGSERFAEHVFRTAYPRDRENILPDPKAFQLLRRMDAGAERLFTDTFIELRDYKAPGGLAVLVVPLAPNHETH